MRSFRLSRAAQVPPGAVKVADKRSDAVVYLYQTGRGLPAALAFHGKADKADFRYAYRTPAEREAAVRGHFAWRQRHAVAVAERRADRSRPHNLEVGHVLSASWGYDQTNVDFYQVTRIVGASTVEVRKIAGIQTGDVGGDRGTVIPDLDNFVGPVLTRRARPSGSVRIDDVRTASIWSGRPASWTSYA